MNGCWKTLSYILSLYYFVNPKSLHTLLSCLGFVHPICLVTLDKTAVSIQLGEFCQRLFFLFLITKTVSAALEELIIVNFDIVANQNYSTAWQKRSKLRQPNFVVFCKTILDYIDSTHLTELYFLQNRTTTTKMAMLAMAHPPPNHMFKANSYEVNQTSDYILPHASEGKSVALPSIRQVWSQQMLTAYALPWRNFD